MQLFCNTIEYRKVLLEVNKGAIVKYQGVETNEKIAPKICPPLKHAKIIWRPNLTTQSILMLHLCK